MVRADVWKAVLQALHEVRESRFQRPADQALILLAELETLGYKVVRMPAPKETR